jgi:hypothetical protein
MLFGRQLPLFYPILLYTMNLYVTHSLAIDAFRQDADLAREQQDYLRLQKSCQPFLERSESQLLELLEQLNQYTQAGQYPPRLLDSLKVTLETRLVFLRRKP